MKKSWRGTSRTLVGDEEIEMAVPLIDGAEVVVPKEDGQLPLFKCRLYKCKHILCTRVYFVYYDLQIYDLVKNKISRNTAKNSVCIANNSENI